jgi:SAM-dependent methyltransferase
MDSKVLSHLNVLRQKVFQVDELWPQYRLLLDDLCEMSDQTPPGAHLVSLERTLLYGGWSLIAPLFQHAEFVSIDCSPKSADFRGAYNAELVSDPRFIGVPTSRRGSAYNTGLPNGEADLVLVPNLVHHVADQERLFSELARIVKPGGRVYVFEALVREIHQAPDDFLRYTPYGLERAFLQAGLQAITPPRTEGGPFQVISYCWTQALQYLPEEVRKAYSNWFFSNHFPELIELDNLYSTNLDKPYSSFPMSFSMMAIKPAIASL